MAKQRIKKASRKERRKEGKQHGGWDYNKKVKGDSWNARYHDGHGNQVGDRNPKERLFGPGETSDRPNNVVQNVSSAAADSGRGSVPQGTTAATQRPGIENWYHDHTFGAVTDVEGKIVSSTRSTSEAEWRKTGKRKI